MFMVMEINTLLTTLLTPLALTLVRIVCGYLFLLHAFAKLFHKPLIPEFSHIQRFSLLWFASILELIGGALLVVGLFTQPTAFILSGLMAFAYFIGHASQGHPLHPVMNKGEPAVLNCFILLLLAATGAGPWSLDALLF